jgi:N-glycosylase/DNA lyase
MRFEMDVALDPTLGCGQAHRWRKQEDGSWQGVIGNSCVSLTQTDGGFECRGDVSRSAVERYFRAEDDLPAIIADISSKDPYVAGLSAKCPGLRILRQPEWECLATYVLATNVNVKRIAKMVESVCDLFGSDLGPRRAFPTPKQILDKKERIGECRLGFRESRFIELAQRTEDGEIDIKGMEELSYGDLVKELITINGVGPKVADCVALFGYGHLEAFPVDVRIQNVMRARYGIEGNYRAVSAAGREKFGGYAGYAQEFLYHSEFI